jgi:hypothetical protein
MVMSVNGGGKERYKRMNNRIRQLVEKAAYTTVSTEGRLFSQQDLAKFAELIVAECAGLVDHVRMEDGTTRGEFIRKHFGVES